MRGCQKLPPRVLKSLQRVQQSFRGVLRLLFVHPNRPIFNPGDSNASLHSISQHFAEAEA